MSRKQLYLALVVWFVLVNLPQVVPALNRIDPLVIVPFNLLWIWGLNLAITVLIVWAFWGGGMPDEEIDFAELRKTAVDQGLMEESR